MRKKKIRKLKRRKISLEKLRQNYEIMILKQQHRHQLMLILILLYLLSVYVVQGHLKSI